MARVDNYKNLAREIISFQAKFRIVGFHWTKKKKKIINN